MNKETPTSTEAFKGCLIFAPPEPIIKYLEKISIVTVRQ